MAVGFLDLDGVSCSKEGDVSALSTQVQHLLDALTEVGYQPGQVDLEQSNMYLPALTTVNAMMASVGVRCTLDNPAADIDTKITSSGDIRYRCRHAPYHEWALDGTQV